MERLEDLTGHWALTRIVLHADGGRAKVRGAASFRPDAEGLAYSEQGHMSLVPAQGRRTILSVQQRYHWSLGDAGLSVRFADGRLFHDLPPGVPVCEVEHPCAPDRYRLRYDFTAWPLWVVTCRVTGPRKDYVMRTSYRRQPSAAPDRPASAATARFRVTSVP